MKIRYQNRLMSDNAPGLFRGIIWISLAFCCLMANACGGSNEGEPEPSPEIKDPVRSEASKVMEAVWNAPSML